MSTTTGWRWRAHGRLPGINVARESLDVAMKEPRHGGGVRRGLEMSGNAAALRDMLRSMNHGGNVAMLG
jgi:threonine 3-dehydrogenase